MTDESWETLLPPLLKQAGITDATGMTFDPLCGGVSSDIVRVHLPDRRQFCAKRALAKLKVASDWRAPVERNHYEVSWLQRAAALVPGVAPKVFGEDRQHGVALLEYLPPQEYALWKTELLAGRVQPGVAAAVGESLGRIHAGTLGDAAVAQNFATDELFEALRLDPYLRFTAGRHPQLADRLLEVLATTAGTRQALVHGDVSPKNILVSREDGHPVLLDAECAWYGDPAFDGAFCLNHLVLKAIHLPALAATLGEQAEAFVAAWMGQFPAALQAELELHTAALLPCLMLARVDGKSPVEYLDEAARQRVRDIAIPLIRDRPGGIVAVFDTVLRS